MHERLARCRCHPSRTSRATSPAQPGATIPVSTTCCVRAALPLAHCHVAVTPAVLRVAGTQPSCRTRPPPSPSAPRAHAEPPALVAAPPARAACLPVCPAPTSFIAVTGDDECAYVALEIGRAS